MPGELTVDGAFPELFREYVQYKRDLGYVYPASRLYLIRRLSRFLARQATDERVLTRQAAEAFATPREGESPGSAAGRCGIARQFALFLRWKGIDAWVLPEREQRRQRNSFAPRIITPDEMARIIACADARPPSRCGPQTQPVYAMLVRLLWCCGLRIGEALSLRVGDVDLAEAVITVHKAKHNRTRLVPMSPSLAAHARRYSAAVGLVPEDPTAWFFPSPARRRLQPRLGHGAHPNPHARCRRHHGHRPRSSRPRPAPLLCRGSPGEAAHRRGGHLRGAAAAGHLHGTRRHPLRGVLPAPRPIGLGRHRARHGSHLRGHLPAREGVRWPPPSDPSPTCWPGS